MKISTPAFVLCLGLSAIFGAVLVATITLYRHSEDKEIIGRLRSELKTALGKLEDCRGRQNEMFIELDILRNESGALKRNRSIQVDLSAYNATERQTDSTPHKNALMKKPKPGLSVAVSRDLQHLLGAVVYIPEVGVRQVDDLMNERYIRSVDVLMPTEKHARDFGKRVGVDMVVVERSRG